MRAYLLLVLLLADFGHPLSLQESVIDVAYSHDVYRYPTPLHFNLLCSPLSPLQPTLDGVGANMALILLFVMGVLGRILLVLEQKCYHFCKAVINRAYDPVSSWLSFPQLFKKGLSLLLILFAAGVVGMLLIMSGDVEQNPGPEYIAQIYKVKKGEDWEVHFVITKDLESHLSAVRQSFGATEDTSFSIGFSSDRISLDIPLDGLALDSGWKITPLNPPIIQKSDVDNFTPGEEIPECVLVSHWSKTDQPPVDLAHKVPLLGARSQEYFMLNINHGQNQTDSPEEDTTHCTCVFKKKQTADTWILRVVIIQDDSKCYHKVTAKNRPLDPFIVERKSSYKSMFVLPSGCPLDVNYPAISDSKLSSILPLVARVPRKLKHLFTTPNLVPVNMMRWTSSPTTYRAHMFKNKVTSDTWKVCVVIVRNDPECEEAVKSELSDYEEAVQPFAIVFGKDKIVLKIQKEDHNVAIPLPEGLFLDGWRITTDNFPEITKKSVDGYCGQGIMPCCWLKVKWKGGDNTELKQLVTLEGAEESSNVFELMCSYEASACAYVFKKKCSADTWIVNVVVVRDYAKCIKAVKDEFQGHDEVVLPFLVEFWRDLIVLKIRKDKSPNVLIPFPEGLDVDGWNITPDNLPEITKECVNRFPDGAIKPFCQLRVKWKGGDNTELKELVTLEGARGPRNVFYLMCHYEGSPKQPHQTEVGTQFEMKPKMIDLILKYKVVEKVDWSILAYALDFDLATVMTISSKCDINMKEACTAVLSMWLGGKDGREPRTWGTLIEVLTDIDQRKLAEEIGYNLRRDTVIKGFEVIDQKTFRYTASFDWSNHGFKLHLPENALPSSIISECRVKVGLVGNFQLPWNTRLVSGVYWVDHPHRLAKDATIEIQHCASIMDSSQVSNVHFVTANILELPFKFRIAKGQFAPNSSYGSIQFRESCIGVVAEPSVPNNFIAQVFFERMDTPNTWTVHFVIVKYLRMYTSAVLQYYSAHYAEPNPQFFAVVFEGNDIELNIPSWGTTLENGWNITPFSSPTITKEDVDRYSPGQGVIPSCQLHMKWTGSGDMPKLTYPVELKGAKKPSNHFTLYWSPRSEVGSPIMIPPGFSDSKCLQYHLDFPSQGDEGKYRCVSSNPAGEVHSESAKLTVAESPQISTQPQDQMDVVGRAAFSVQVNGTQPLSYRWECNLDGSSEWQLVASRASGDDTNVLVIDHIQKGDEGKYRCVISNLAGEVHSESAKLTVAESPQISTQPQDQMDVVGRAAFSVQVLGTQPLSYRWECNLDGSSEWQLVPSRASGDDTNVLVIDHIQKGDEGKYRCVISNPAGEVHSESAKLTVAESPQISTQPPQISTQPQDQMDVVGRAAFSVQVNGTQPLSYRWECNLDGSSEWQLVASRASGDDTNVLVIDHIQKGDEGKYRCVISNPAGEVHSESARLTVAQPPQISTESQTPVLGTQPLSYCWECNLDGSSEWQLVPSRASEAFVSLATNDSYGTGALALGKSLRDSATSKRLALLITNGVSQDMRGRLSRIWDELILIEELDSGDVEHLALLTRPELGVTFTKIHAWKLTQYSKCVFLDADALVLQNVDELFDREELSAAPDIGWPDCFNSGVFVFEPAVETFKNLLDLACNVGSFDGGDQGLLNLYWSDWATKDIKHHLPFIYNVVPNVTYGYAPAFLQFGRNAKIIHFIGPVKPWQHRYLPEMDSVILYPGTYSSQHAALDFIKRWWQVYTSVDATAEQAAPGGCHKRDFENIQAHLDSILKN